MSLRELATCPATTCTPTTSLRDAARLMGDAGVGFLVVVGGDGRPVGVITDRDIVLRAVASGRDGDTTVEGVMTPHVHGVHEHATAEDAANVMADKQCRRLALTGADGHVVGVISLDDLLRATGSELQHVARLVRGIRLRHEVIP